MVKVGVGSESRLRSTGLKIRWRTREVIDGIGSTLIPSKTGVYLPVRGEMVSDMTVVVAGGAVGSVLVGINESCDRVDALVGPCTGAGTFVTTGSVLLARH